MATYLETPETLLTPNGAPAWHVEFDPADDFPQLKSYRVVLLGRKPKRRRFAAGTASEVHDALSMIATHDREAIYLLLLDKKRKVFGIYLWGLGGPSSCLADPASAMRVVLATFPKGGVVIVHNHPSGDPSPSAEDRALTRRMGGMRGMGGMLALFDYELVDHVIVGSEGFFSFAQAGML